MLYNHTSKRSAFTLIELLVVISIIALLSSVVLSSLSTSRSKARDTQRIAQMKQFQTALELYYNDNGKYPYSGWISSFDSTWNTTSDLSIALKPYLSKLPVDPLNTGTSIATASTTYAYSYFSSGYPSTNPINQQWYMLLFNTENPNPIQNNDGSLSCSGTPFNYSSITLGGSCVN